MFARVRAELNYIRSGRIEAGAGGKSIRDIVSLFSWEETAGYEKRVKIKRGGDKEEEARKGRCEWEDDEKGDAGLCCAVPEFLRV